eukprot:TRINITY_DN10751_c0_g1_i1.p1 TRINITY_DN10751_c0_g1~~TRINITY_DN10751_c0_g1_i1.p1  ORF type:complete len:153 (-),score=19.35 TRINITY_DN10751_c0_g1_i1:246-704(-)
MLPLLPISLLASEEPFLVSILGPISILSCFPLLVRDGVALAYVGVAGIWIAGVICAWPRIICDQGGQKEGVVGWQNMLKMCIMFVSIGGGVMLHVLQAALPPPERYPFLYPMLMTTYSFGHFFIAMIYLNWRHLTLGIQEDLVSEGFKKKRE